MERCYEHRNRMPMRLHYSSYRNNNHFFCINEAVISVIREDIKYMFGFLRKHRHLIEVWWIIVFIFLGVAVFSRASTYKSIKTFSHRSIKVGILAPVMAQASPNQVTIQTGNDSDKTQQITMKWNGQDVAYYVGFIGVGLSLALSKIFEVIINAKEKWNKIEDASAQGKLSKCEEQLQVFLKVQQQKDDANRASLAAMASNLQSVMESNDKLNQIIAKQVITISQISSASVMAGPTGVTQIVPPNHPVDPPQQHP